LVQFPLGIFAIAVGTVALPAMSRHAAHGDLEGLRETLGHAFRQVSLIMIPAAVGLIVLREPILNLLFQRGRFDPVATRMSAQALLGYSVGLWFVAEIRVVAPAFYALKDTVTPVKVATLAIIINVLLSMLLMGSLGHGGLALAVSISAACQLGMLLWKLTPRLGGIHWRGMFGSAPKALLASVGMGVLCWAIVRGISWTGEAPLLLRMGVMGGGIVAGVLFYGIVLKVLRVRELQDLLAAFVSRLGERER
jgi:putative peptidoglycan lipid II flippase